jgi:hypothetical protein
MSAVLAPVSAPVSSAPPPSPRPPAASTYQFVAIPSAVADAVRATLAAPKYGHPAHVEVATGHGPCRHCLRTFRVGEERRILFTYDAFAGVEPLPQPGPVFIHAEACARYDEAAGFPDDLRAHSLTLVAFARGRAHRAEVHVPAAPAEAPPGAVEAALDALFARRDIDYVHVRDTDAGCYDLRVERAPSTAVSDAPTEAEDLPSG